MHCPKPKRKIYRLIDRSTSYFVVGGIAFLYILCFGLSCFFADRFLIKGYDPTAWPLIIILIAPCILIAILDHRGNILKRFQIKFTIDKEGIHCWDLIWGKFEIPWDSVRTYGIFNSSYAYMSVDLIFLSQDASERYNKNTIANISKSRLIFENRKEIQQAFAENMPKDMWKGLDDAIRHNRSAFYKR